MNKNVTSRGEVFYDTPEYWAWVKKTDERISGRNSVTRQRKSRDYPGYVVLPAGASDDFKEGFIHHAKLYKTTVKEDEPNG